MPRLPYLEFVSVKTRIPRGESGIWSVMVELDASGPWSARDIWTRTAENAGSTHQLLRRLKAGGYVEQVGEKITGGRNPQVAPLYRLKSRPVEMPRLRKDGTPLPELAIDTLWRTIKMAKTFTASELADLASRGVRPINSNTARSYCDHLTRAGVLSRVTGKDRRSRYTLIHNVGAHAPKVLASRIVFDPNTQTVLGDADAREVSP